MKILHITTPIRPTPTCFAPIGSLSILQAMRKNNINNFEFYNIDAFRPSYEEALDHVISAKPDVLVISAVVSTAYEYSKRIAGDVRAALPDVLIVLGGCLATSAEILLKKTEVDVCVTGEGEITNCNVYKQYAKTRNIRDLVHIPGLVLYIDHELINTGYEQQVLNDEIYDVRWEDLEDSTDKASITQFFYPAFNEDGVVALEALRGIDRVYEPHRRDKYVGQLASSKGCVARCTFCHRFTQGMRYIPLDVLASRIEEQIEKYNIGFLSIVDENFGTDKEWLEGFCKMIKKYDLLWLVSGIRVNTASPEKLLMMKNAGCVQAIYGMETGSPDMLKVMEKRVKIEHNYQAIKWTVEAGLYTNIQLVLGMPGESPRTISETSRFVKHGMSISPHQNPTNISINYAQALPGTPLYEYARHQKLIGASLDEEEQYLLKVSDRNPSDTVHQINFTKYPRLQCETWRLIIAIECNYHYARKYGLRHYYKKIHEAGHFVVPEKSSKLKKSTRIIKKIIGLNSYESKPDLLDFIKFRKYGILYIFYPRISFYMRSCLPLYCLLKYIINGNLSFAKSLAIEYLNYKLNVISAYKNRKTKIDTSLRTLLKTKIGTLEEDNPMMTDLRLGR